MGNQLSRENESNSADSLSVVMRNPENIFLIAETGVRIERLRDVIKTADHTLNSLQKAGDERGIPLQSVPHITQRLCKELDASEVLLDQCQHRVNELVGLHSDSCSNPHIQKLVDKLSSCQKRKCQCER